MERQPDKRTNEPALSPEIRAELDRRLEEHHANPSATLSWSEVRCRVLEPQNRYSTISGST
ncbi:MAG: addiction module protein [Myxococcales bacterium]|nr:addiction module protein [Myxococcales bacterium]